MNSIEEVINNLIAGQKIRRKEWHRNRYIHFVNGSLRNMQGLKVSYNFEDYENWELYSEPPKKKCCGD